MWCEKIILSLSTPIRHKGGMDVQRHSFLHSTLEWGKWSNPGRFMPVNKHSAHWKGGWLGPTPGLNCFAEQKISCSFDIKSRILKRICCIWQFDWMLRGRLKVRLYLIQNKTIRKIWGCMHRASPYNMCINQQDAQISVIRPLFSHKMLYITCFGLSLHVSDYISPSSEENL